MKRNAARTCAVIGAGIGGLSAASRLKKIGLSVDLYEKNPVCGGKAGIIDAGPYRFDSGPSLLTMPFILDELMKDCGLQSNPVKTRPLDAHCRYFYSDGTSINAWSDRDAFAEEIASRTNDSAESAASYLDYCAKIYSSCAEVFLFNDFHDPMSINKKSMLKALLGLRNIDPLRTVHEANSFFFKDPKTIQLFDRYATYNGSDPYRAPATLNIIPHVEYNMGSFIAEGGIRSIPDALLKLALSVGVRVFNSSYVDSILTDKNDRVKGVTVNGDERDYDIVLSNSDVSLTYSRLLRDSASRTAKNYYKLGPSSSAIVFYFGVRGTMERIGIHNILFSTDYKNEFKDIFEKKKCPDDPTVYIYVSSKYCAADAPAGCENWFVMVNAPYDSGQDWTEEVSRTKKVVLEKIRRMTGEDLSPKITHEKSAAPPDIERETGSAHGSIYGLSSNTRSAAFFRQPNRSSRYAGLYFCGGSAHPGGGIPLALLSGRIASAQIARYEL
jgi:phytoene desaturase